MKIPLLSPGRYFLALWPPATVRDAIARAAALWLPAATARCRRVAPERYHLTLQFLGDLDGPAAHRLERMLGRLAATPHPAFALCLDQMGDFGQRVGWLGPRHPPHELMALQRRVSQLVRRAGLASPSHAVFSPHVTLARDHRGTWPADLPEGVLPIRWPVTAWTLVTSLPAPARGYRVVARQPLHTP